MNLRRNRICIVDTDLYQAKTIKKNLLSHGNLVDVEVFASLQEYRMKATSFCPDVLLLDLNLPDRQTIDYLKKATGHQTYPTLIMATRATEAVAVATLKLGATDYFVKTPENFSSITRIVESCLREFRAQLAHREALLALQKKEQLYCALLQKTGTPLFVLDSSHRVIDWNTACEKLTGINRAEVIGTRTHWKAFYDHERPCLADAVLDQLNEHVLVSLYSSFARLDDVDGGLQAEAWLSCADGEDKYIFFNAVPVHNDSGEVIAVIETLQDMTERKYNEQQLRKFYQIVEQSPVMVVITNLKGVIEYVNPKFTEYSGYSFAEVQGRNPSILRSGETDPAVYRQLWNHLLAGEEWQGELLNRHKDGHLMWERARISPLRDDQGNITHYIGIKEDITSQKEYECQLKHQATHDHLTGLANWILLKDRLEQAIMHAQRANKLVAVLLLDLDHFKKVNDGYGHALGDELLCMVANRLQNTVRQTDTVARLGGDEFVVMLTDVADLEAVKAITANILKTLAKPYSLKDHTFNLSASVGGSLYPYDGLDGPILIRNADIAMSEAKKQGNHFSYYAEGMNSHLVATLEMENDLHQAIARDELCLHYQPKVDLATGRVAGCEALLRWQHPQRGLVSPGKFIPIAEQTGLIVPIGIWVLEEVCRQILDWQAQGFPPVRVAVNLSARQFCQGDLVATVKAVLERHGLDPTLLELELTESMVMDNPEDARQTLQELKSIGITLSLDDFGTGYSSLNYLRHFPVDSLKIDQSFIRDVTIDPSGASVVASIIDIAHNLKLIAIAEGVETQEQLEFLVANECDAVQGYLFSKPLPPEEIAQLLKQDGQFLQQRA